MHRLVATVVLCLALTATVCRGQGILSGPLNEAAYASSSIMFSCRATPGDRVQYVEYVTNPNNNPILISDNDQLLPSHPNYARYSMSADLALGYFNLTISNTVVGDGGRYECRDENTGTSRFAELVIFSAAPNCSTGIPAGGFVTEGVRYTIECTSFFGSSDGVYPVMVWTGPGTFNQLSSNQSDSVQSGVGFDVQKVMDNQFFTCRTYFTENPFGGVDTADNVPDFLNVYNSIRLFVRYGPQNISYVPVKSSYEIGDRLTCYSDASPLPTYKWRILSASLEYISQTFTVTEAMVGDAVFICEISNMIATANIYINTTVNPITTPTTPTTTPTTTPVPAVSNCLDLTGRWEYVRSGKSKAVLCMYVDTEDKQLLTGLFWNDTETDAFYLDVIGRKRPDNDEIGLVGIWPLDGGVTSLALECHRCYGDESLLANGMSVANKDTESCGDDKGFEASSQYEFTRVDWSYPCGPPSATKTSKHISMEAAAKRTKRMAVNRYS